MRCLKRLVTPWCSSIARHTPHGPHEFQGPEHELDHLHVAVLLAAGPIHGGEPTLLGIINTGIRHQEMLGLLDAHGIVIHQDLHRLSPERVVDIETEVVEPNLTLLPHLAGLLTEAEDPSEAGRFAPTPQAGPLGTPGLPRGGLGWHSPCLPASAASSTRGRRTTTPWRSRRHKGANHMRMGRWLLLFTRHCPLCQTPVPKGAAGVVRQRGRRYCCQVHADAHAAQLEQALREAHRRHTVRHGRNRLLPLEADEDVRES